MDDNLTQMNLYKVLTSSDSGNSAVVFYARSVFKFKLIDASDLIARPTISFRDGTLIWTGFNGPTNYDTVTRLNVCPINALYDKET